MADAPGAGNPQALNRYAYGFSNPLKYTDPDGHCATDPSRGDDWCSSYYFDWNPNSHLSDAQKRWTEDKYFESFANPASLTEAWANGSSSDAMTAAVVIATETAVGGSPDQVIFNILESSYGSSVATIAQWTRSQNLAGSFVKLTMGNGGVQLLGMAASALGPAGKLVFIDAKHMNKALGIRGRTEDMMLDVINSPARIGRYDVKGDPSVSTIWYFDKAGEYVVVNTKTGEVLQVSHRGLRHLPPQDMDIFDYP